MDQIAEYLKGADMVFITCGLGGGTGTGASSVIAEVSKELGALTVAVVTKPFAFEGKTRDVQAEEGLQNLKSKVDTLITIPNQRLLSVGGKNMTIKDAFFRADEVLLYAVRSISDLIISSGHVNVDFADVKTVMSEKGMAIMGVGIGSGEGRALDAAQKAISSPLLEDISIHGAKGVLINVTGSSSMTLHEVHEASSLIQEQAHEDARVIWGLVFDEAMEDSVRISVIATGFAEQVAKQKEEPIEIVRHERLSEERSVLLYEAKDIDKDVKPRDSSRFATRYICLFLRKQEMSSRATKSDRPGRKGLSGNEDRIRVVVYLTPTMWDVNWRPSALRHPQPYAEGCERSSRTVQASSGSAIPQILRSDLRHFLLHDYRIFGGSGGQSSVADRTARPISLGGCAVMAPSHLALSLF